MSEEQLEAVELANAIRDLAIENQALTAHLAEVEGRLREAVELVQRWTTEMGSHAPIGLGLDTDEFLKPQQQGEAV